MPTPTARTPAKDAAAASKPAKLSKLAKLPKLAKSAASKPAAAKPAAAKAAPKFDLESDEGARVRSGDFAGKWLVVYFYPRDNTPGCTREAQDFTKAVARLKKVGAEVVGISKDSVKSHCGFKEKIGITFPLLSDPDLVAHKAFGAWGTKVMYGKSVEGTLRSTFLVSPDGKLVQSWKSVKVDGHVDKVLAALEEAQEAQRAQ
jgi:peroxiredoxin Q/BCP